VAGVKEREIFVPSTMEEIYRASSGIPRLINIICDAALVTGYVKEREQITDTLINGVISELKIDAIQVYPEPTTQKLEAGSEAKTVGIQQTSQLTAKSHYREGDRAPSQAEWERRLLEKQNELNVKQEKLCEKLEQLLNLERELIARERKIRKREMELETPKKTATG
jgi:hypothetical protein